ncbi:unnamed protein product [Nesidiocoris tenuis]|uniref:C2H2-type domain-containing protein n=1 Tax=Nesidiocoris tenuis TaxID=355587 RepID=A0A6H5GKH2_9HEMI|nr:unnamed protein product [Nesidiocoris tenuis]
MEEDLGDVKILIIPEVSESRDGDDAPLARITTDLKNPLLDEGLKRRIVEFLKKSAAAEKEEQLSLDIETGSNFALSRRTSSEGNYDDNCDKQLEASCEEEEDVHIIVNHGMRPVKSDPSKKHHCKLCFKSFNHKSTLSRHKLLSHSPNPPSFTCAHCNRRYKTKVSLRRHLASIEAGNHKRKSSLKVNCALCPALCCKSEMVEHYENDHDKTIEKELIKFRSEDEFLRWKHRIENETTARFTKIRKNRIIKDGTTESFYRCHRDGTYKPRGQNLRHLKKMGSNKINGHCPAKMQVWIDRYHEVSVMFVKTHVGHDMEITRLTLTKQERDHIAQQLALQVPFDAILQACRESAVGAENIRRMNLLTRKDLYNIESSYCLSKLTSRNCLGINVDQWVKQMINEHCDTFIKFYKQQGVTLDDYPNLGAEHFILVLMNEVQTDVLKCRGNNIVCVDTTSVGSEFSIVTLLVLDDRNSGFPVAFSITNNCDLNAYKMFFAAIVDASGKTFQPRILISNLDDSIYKAWNSVMEPPSFRIFSPWVVDEEWRSNLDKIVDPEKQVTFYNKLVSIMEETNVQTFEEELDVTHRELKADPETEEFAEFFDIYKSKASAWAHCFRVHLGDDVNDQISLIQDSLKIVYKCKLKKVSNLEKFIISLMTSVKEHIFVSPVALGEVLTETIATHLRNRHIIAEEIPKNAVCKRPKHWTVAHGEKADTFYKVKVFNAGCDCSNRCEECSACQHGYLCSCVESSLKWFVCEHIHAVCSRSRANPGSSSSRSQSIKNEVDDTEAFYGLADSEMSVDDENAKNMIINVPESAYQYMTAEGEDGNVLLTFETEDLEDNAELILGYAEEDQDVNVEERRSLLAQKCQKILNRISSEAQVAAFEQAMASLETDVTFIE